MFQIPIRRLIILFLFINVQTFGQEMNKPSYFGIQLKPIIPSSIGGSKSLTLTGENYLFQINQTLGYAFGGTIRKSITKLIAFESGLNFVQRNFSYQMSLTDTAVNAKDNFSFISYEIPINGLIYIQLNRNTFMNTSLGMTARFSPTDIKKITVTNTLHSFTNYGYYYSKLGANMNANVGFEFRTEKRGIFYLGGSISVPLTPIMKIRTVHSISGSAYYDKVDGEIDGNYLSIDFKYFIPTIHKKGEQPLKPIIE